uniref:Peptidase M13 N-terminal domain-containing protein n=1 Tax=Stomoxys calcitrans TaxID=35570 RepID=A0A1I8NM60_STOCA
MSTTVVLKILPLGILLLGLVQGAATQTTTMSLTVEQRKLQSMESSMGLDQPICTNFYKYACEKWSFLRSIETIRELEENIGKQMDQIIGVFPNLKYPQFLSSIHNHYQSCKNRGEFEVLNYLKWMHDNTDIKWPLVRQQQNEGKDAKEAEEALAYDWIELLALTRSYGFNDIFIYESVVQRQDDPLKLIIEIKRPALYAIGDLRSQVYDTKGHLQHMDMEGFRNFQLDLLNLTVRLVERLEKASFEHIMETKSQPGDTKPQLVRVKELQLPWLVKYLETLLNRSPLDADMEIYINSVEYLHTVYSFMNERGNRFMTEYIQLRFFIYLQQQHLNRGFECGHDIRESFPLVMQWAYEQNNLQLKWQIPRVEKMYDNLKQQFRQSLLENRYNFGENVHQYLLEKLDNLQLMMGQMNVFELQRYYNNLSLAKNNYYGNHLQITNFHFKRLHEALYGEQLTPSSPVMWHLQQFAEYGQSLDKTLTLAHLPKLYPRLNVIYLPLTLLQPPYYEDGLSEEFIYGSTGFWLAHAIVKSFDQHHLAYDAQGKVNIQMLQQIQSNQKFEKSLIELRRDFAKNDFGDSENVGNDLGGLKLAYNSFAALKRANHLNRAFTLHNSSFTSEQLQARPLQTLQSKPRHVQKQTNFFLARRRYSKSGVQTTDGVSTHFPMGRITMSSA